jgi:gamma-glutamyltranspeptidase/glutathione hydrolase
VENESCGEWLWFSRKTLFAAAFFFSLTPMNPALNRSWCLCLISLWLKTLASKGDAALDRSQARSMVISKHGIVASEHPQASQAGAMILAEGGHAVDAAVAANAAMGLFSPMMCGIGGDLFAIVYEAETGNLYGLNASGWAPEKMSISRMKELGHDSIPIRGIYPVTVPGAVDGWSQLLERFGRLGWSDVLAPAIHHAESGFPVSELVAGYWDGNEDLLGQDPRAKAAFLPDGRVPRVGEVFRNPDLAWTYRQIAENGRKAFYEGEIAGRILELMREKQR